MGEPVKVKVEGPEKTTIIDVKLSRTKVTRITKLLRENRYEFTWSLTDMSV